MSYRDFLRECAEYLDEVASGHPSFWSGLREELGRIQLSRGAREHRAIQASVTMVNASTHTSVELNEGEGRATPEEWEARQAPRQGTRKAPRRREGPLHPRGCWNCGGPHRYSVCPEPRRQFCYRCGESGLTVKGCPTCGKAWRAEGPFRGRRARSVDDAHRRGAPTARARHRSGRN